MVKWLVPVLALTTASLTGFGYVVLRLDPARAFSPVWFVVTFFLSTAFVLSLILFFVRKKFFLRPRTFDAFGPVITEDELRHLFRTSLRKAFLIAAILTALLVLRKLV